MTETITVHKTAHNSHFTVISNDIARLQINGDPITSKDILLDALSCTDTWLWTTPNISKRYKISEKKAQRLCTRLVKAGYAERCTVRDPATGQILMHHYIFYEKPLDKICPEAQSSEQPENKEENNDITTGQNLSSISIKKKHIEETAVAQPDPKPKILLKSSAAAPLFSPDIESEIKNTLIPRDIIKIGIENHDPDYILALIKVAKSKNPINPTGYIKSGIDEKYDSIWLEIENERKRQTSEIERYNQAIQDNQGSLDAIKESIENAIPYEEMHEATLKSRGQWERHLELEAERKAAEKERRERTVSKPFCEIKPLFLEYAGELAGDEIKNAFQKMTDDQIRNRIEFKNYCYGKFWECSN